MILSKACHVFMIRVFLTFADISVRVSGDPSDRRGLSKTGKKKKCHENVLHGWSEQEEEVAVRPGVFPEQVSQSGPQLRRAANWKTAFF